MQRLKSILDRYYIEFDFKKRLLHDPIEIPHRYDRPEDIEVSAYIASCLAYGRVDLFKPVIEKILSIMGRSPYDFLVNFMPGRQGGLFRGISYRFNKYEDITCLIYMLHVILLKHGSIETLFMSNFNTSDRNIGNALSSTVREFISIDSSGIYGRNLKPSGLMQFLPSPENGSACKRQNLFLRWMTRDSDIDFGLWKDLPKDRLIIPLDTHIMRISRCLGLTGRRSSDWKTAVEITDSLKRFDPDDPLKYDFALCHHGISGLCRGVHDAAACNDCVFGQHKMTFPYNC